MNFNLKGWKKIKDVPDHSIFKHPTGHELKISKNALTPEMGQQLNKLPVQNFDTGGVAQTDSTQINPSAPIPENLSNQDSNIDYDKAEKDVAAGNAPYTMEEEPTKSVTTTQSSADGTIQNQETPQSNDFGQGLMGAGQEQLNALQEQKRGQMIEAQAQGQAGSQTAEAAGQAQNSAQQGMAEFQKNYGDLDQETQNIKNDIANGHINPNEYIENMTTGGKIATGIGLILGGMGAGLTHGPNLAFQYLQNQIDRDVEGQKLELGKKENLLSHNLQAMGNLRAATDLTRMQSMDILSNHLKQIAGTAQSQAAAGMALNTAGLIDGQTAQLKKSLAIQKMQLGGGTDPARLVPLLVPSEHQKQALAEIEAAENTVKMKSAIDTAFEKAAHDNTVMRTGAGLLRTPPSVLALHQAMQPTFKDLEGTVRQAAMDNTFKNITPAPGDFGSSINEKRTAKDQYLQSKMSAPTARAYLIDLKNFKSTSIQGPQQTKVSGGVKYIRGPNGEAIPVK